MPHPTYIQTLEGESYIKKRETINSYQTSLYNLITS